MASLSTDLRNQLGTAIKNARREAEAGALNALESLAVARHEPHGSMTPEERTLRNRLRAHGRQLGDVRNKVRGTQSIDRLAHEVAYEHWHRMLFARFLAENGLLIDPETGVAISTEECEELAREAGEDPRSMAARFAQDSLPQIFSTGDPVLEVILAPETQQALDRLLDGLPTAVFTADDSLGWTYQYWQTERKKAVNDSGVKIGADELPAVTQLFTEHYMVLFLYHNTIGAWHAGKVLAQDPSLAETAQSEEELRQAVRLRSQGGYDFEYLRFVREAKECDEEDAPTGPWRPAAGTFEGWPQTAKELKVLDPCCGSGHFLIEGFELLVRLRMVEDGLSLVDTIRGVLADNLHGLELDPRCTQIAAFSLAMAAWKLAGGPVELPALHIACSGLAVGSTKREWVALAGDDEALIGGMQWLYEQFELAPELGSLMDPSAHSRDLRQLDYDTMSPLLASALEREAGNEAHVEQGVAAQGMIRATELLSTRYTLAITNVPYLARGKQSVFLKEYADENCEEARADIATMFVSRMLHWLGQHGTLAAVTPQNWLFLTSYRGLREKLLSRRRWNVVARLGSNAFRDMNYWAATTTLVAISAEPPSETTGTLGLDVSQSKERSHKRTMLRGGAISGSEEEHVHRRVRLLKQARQLENPDCRIVLQRGAHSDMLSLYATSHKGITTGDDRHARRAFWEFGSLDLPWRRMQTTVKRPCDYGGLHEVMLWGERGEANDWGGLEVRGEHAWGRVAVAINMMNALPSSLYTGVLWDQNFAVVLPKTDSYLLAIRSFCSSPEYTRAVREVDQQVKVTNATLVKVPFDLKHWQKVAAKEYPNGLPEPRSNDPTQWLFHGHPADAELATILQIAVGRLLAYRWPPELDLEMHLADEAREWVVCCEALNDFADDDGIVCLSATRGERSAADRLRELLSAAFGSNWSAAKERQLLTVAGDAKKPATTLDIWLRDKFFEEHCKLFHHRPFVWHLWDGNKDGFHCLVNAHKLTGPDGEGRRTLEAITYSYLGDWIDRQKADQTDGVEGADARLAAAQDLQGQLVKILEGVPPYDIFVRWKPLHEQAIGWEPDINDGVRLNIRPFMSAELRKGGRAGAGILRWKPNIKWGPKADRGKEPESLRPKFDFPWFWGCNGDGDKADRTDFRDCGDFDGNRWNDLHYSIAVKQAVREAKEET